MMNPAKRGVCYFYVTSPFWIGSPRSKMFLKKNYLLDN
jgi:hypothetical protein